MPLSLRSLGYKLRLAQQHSITYELHAKLYVFFLYKSISNEYVE